MDTRVAVISIIVEQDDAIEELNTLLHEAAASTLLAEWGFHTVQKESASSALPLMRRRIRSAHFLERSDT